MKAVTKRQTEVLSYIRSFMNKNKYPPTVREVAAHFGISVRAAYDHLRALEKKGLISCGRHRSRAIEIIDQEDHHTESHVDVPVLGHVAAGTPVLSEENYDDFLSLPASMTGRGTPFALRVEGDSMIGAGILDGDIAVISQQNQVENGQIAVVRVDEAVTLKRVYKEKTRMRLQPENPAYKPTFSQDVQILGRLVSLIRSY